MRTSPVVRAGNAGLGVGIKIAQANRAESARTILVKTAQATRRLTASLRKLGSARDAETCKDIKKHAFNIRI